MFISQLSLTLSSPCATMAAPSTPTPATEKRQTHPAVAEGAATRVTVGYSDSAKDSLACLGLEPDEHPSIRPFLALWRAVLVQQVMDLKSESKDPDKVALKNHSKNWLFGTKDAEDFETVCDLGMMEPGYVRTSLRRARKRGFGWRKLAESKR